MSFKLFFAFFFIILTTIWWFDAYLRQRKVFFYPYIKNNEVLMISVFLLFLWQLYNRIVLIDFYHLDLVSNDNNIIYGIQRILRNEYLYQNPNIPPYAIMQYTPLYYYLAAGLARLFGILADNVHGLFILCRVFNLWLNLLSLAVLWQIGRVIKLSVFQKSLASIFIFTLFIDHYWARCDSLYFLFFVAAIYYSVSYFEKNENVIQGNISNKKATFYPLLIGIMSAIGFFSKQSLPYPIIVFCLIILFTKQWRTLFYTILGFLMTAFLLYSIVAIQGISWFVFYQNVVEGVRTPVGFHIFGMLLALENTPLIPLLLVGLYFVPSIFTKYRGNDWFFYYKHIALFLSLFLGFVTAFKLGSDVNYFNEYLVFLAFSVFNFFTILPQKSAIKQTIISSFSFYLMFFSLFKISRLFFVIHLSVFPFKLENDIQLFENQQFTANYLKTKIKDNEYVQTNSLNFFGNFLPKNALFPQRDIKTSKKYDYTLYQKNGNTGMIRYIVLAQKDTFPMTYLGLRLDNFRLDTTINGSYKVYEYHE